MAFKMNGFPTHRGTSMAQQKGVQKLKKDLPRDPGNRGTEVKWDSVRQEYIPINTPPAKSPPTPQPTSMAKQKLNKGGEGQDQNKIFDKEGNHVGDYVNGKKVMLKKTNGPAKQAETGPTFPHGQETITKGFTSDSDYEGIVNDKKNSRSYIRKYDLMSKEDKANARIRDTGQVMIEDSDGKGKTGRKITLASGDKDVVFQ